jgi:hypothetical protein
MNFPHVMFVTRVNGTLIEIIHMIDRGLRIFYYDLPAQELTIENAPGRDQEDCDVIIRWKGDREVLEQVLHTANAIKHKDIRYSEFGAAFSLFGECFVSPEEAYKEMPSIASLDESFCSEFIFVLWGSVLKNLGDVKGEPLIHAMPVSPYYCHPYQFIELAEKFPEYWQRITIFDPTSEQREYRRANAFGKKKRVSKSFKTKKIPVSRR